MADAKALVEKLYRAFNDPGFLGLGGTDEEGCLDALRTARDQGIMRDVDALYAKTYPAELNLKDELDDELSGDDFDQAMAYYNEGMQAPADSRTAGTGASGTRGSGSGMPTAKVPVHGTLAPGSPGTVWVELLDDERKPLPGARCRLAGGTEAFTADENGIVELPIRAGASQIEIEWEEKDAAPDDGPDLPRYYWNQTLQLDVLGDDESALSRQLSNLSFDGQDLKQQVLSYQEFYGQPRTGNIGDIQAELSQRIKNQDRMETRNA